MADDDDEVIDAEIVDDGDGELTPLIPPDTILTPCHHGCTCGLHQQTVYGERVPLHLPSDLDHGEMALLVEAAGHAARLMNDFHDHFRKLRAAATRTHGQARRALRELTLLLGSDAAAKARAERDRVEVAYADLTPAERQPAPRWLKVTAVAAVVGMTIFDAYFFQQTFLDILGLTVNDAWWKRDIGLVAALVLAIGLIAAGRVLAGPIWRLGRRWRRPASPDDKPPRRAARLGRILAIGAAPAGTFFVLGWWASVRGQAAVITESAIASNSTAPPPIPNGFSVMLLLLSLALTVIVLEVLVYNPYQADMRRAERSMAKLRKQVSAGTDAVTDALDTHEIAWRDMRSARDDSSRRSTLNSAKTRRSQGIPAATIPTPDRRADDDQPRATAQPVAYPREHRPARREPRRCHGRGRRAHPLCGSPQFRGRRAHDPAAHHGWPRLVPDHLVWRRDAAHRTVHGLDLGASSAAPLRRAGCRGGPSRAASHAGTRRHGPAGREVSGTPIGIRNLRGRGAMDVARGSRNRLFRLDYAMACPDHGHRGLGGGHRWSSAGRRRGGRDAGLRTAR